MGLESVLREQGESDSGAHDAWEIRQNPVLLSVRAATAAAYGSREEAEEAAVELVRALARSEPDLVLCNRAEIGAVAAPGDGEGWRGKVHLAFARQWQVDGGQYSAIPLP